MSTYITIADVRAAIGVSTDQISDTQLQVGIDAVENYAERFMNCKFTPTREIEIVDGNGLSYLFMKKSPLLAVRQLKSNSTSIDTSTIHVYRNSGKIALSPTSDSTIFTAKTRSVAIDYYHGWIEGTSTTATSSADADEGTTATITVDSTTGFTAEDWIMITGMDGYEEYTKISSVNAGVSLVVDELVFDHESGSLIKLCAMPPFIERYLVIESAIYAVLNVLGASVTFNSGFALGEFSAQKGVPHPHYTALYGELVKERNSYKSMIRPRMNMAI